tara:strand:- start:141 stop:899 length:759 start_codon:yes stop_codon:yes gene_type:complete
MKNNLSHRIFVAVLLLLSMVTAQAQEDRVLLRGQVIYRDINVPNEHVINITTETATITDEDGRFSILVKAGDQLAFTAVNYQIKVVDITEALLQTNRLVVDVKEKVTELDEVVVSPEDQERFLKVQNEEFKKYEYETDRSSEVENIAMSQSEKGMRDGINFVNIFKAIMKASANNKDVKIPMKASEVLRQVYDDEFFVVDLQLPQDKIDAFLYYLDAQKPEQSLLKKDQEFQLIDYLVTQSKAYLIALNAEK